jgi:hypothetical protein
MVESFFLGAGDDFVLVSVGLGNVVIESWLGACVVLILVSGIRRGIVGMGLVGCKKSFSCIEVRHVAVVNATVVDSAADTAAVAQS